MIKGFHHAAISTPDLERCIEFYTQTIGGEVAWTFGWERGTPEADAVTGLTNSAARAAMLKIGDTFLEVFDKFEVGDVSDGAAVQIMTVHKSKGLTFDLVFLPDLDGDTLGSRDRSDGLVVGRGDQGEIQWAIEAPPGRLAGLDEA